MKFYFDDGECFDLLETILIKEKIHYTYEYEDDLSFGSVVWSPFGIQINHDKNKRLVVHTDLEHYDFINFLLKKELKKEKKRDKMLKTLEKCYKLTKSKTKKKSNDNIPKITITCSPF